LFEFEFLKKQDWALVAAMLVAGGLAIYFLAHWIAN
jgi:hypothetical protein